MNKSKEKALNEAGWKLGSADEFLGIQKLDFGFLQHDDVLEAYTYDENNKRNGHVHIFYKKNFIVSAYLDKVLYEIKNNCKDIYEALDAANQWYNSIRNKNQNEENTWEHITKDKNGRVIKREKSDGFWEERTYNEAGQELTFKNSEGCWCEITYDENENMLTVKDSDGTCFEEGLGWGIIKENIRKH